MKLAMVAKVFSPVCHRLIVLFTVLAVGAGLAEEVSSESR